MDCNMPDSPVLHYLLEFAQTQSIDSVMLSNHLILCHPLLLSWIFSSIRVFYNELALFIRWPKYWSFSISPSNEFLGLISFRIHSLYSIQSYRQTFPWSTKTVLTVGHSSEPQEVPVSELIPFCLGLLRDIHFPLSSFQSFQSLSRVWLFATPWTAARQASLSSAFINLLETSWRNILEHLSPKRGA